MPAPPGLITVYSKLFDEKTAQDKKFEYDGIKNGSTWRSDVFDYLVSRCPGAGSILRWAEQKGPEKITPELIRLAMTTNEFMQDSEDPQGSTVVEPKVLGHHVWGFLQHCLTGAAKQTFRNTDRQDGLNVWRKLVMTINSRTHCRRHALRQQVQEPQPAANLEGIMARIADWETH